MDSETSLALALIRAHYDEPDKSFDAAALKLAQFYDKIDKPELSEYIFAYVYPGLAFTTFEEFYYPGTIVYTISDDNILNRYKVLCVEESGCWLQNLVTDSLFSRFFTYPELTKDFLIEKSI